MAAAYRTDLSRLSSNSVGLLRVDQVQWLAYVQQVCTVNDAATTRAAAAGCLQPLYDDRIKQLRGAVAVRDGLAFLNRTQFLAAADVPDKDSPAPPSEEHEGFGTLQVVWPAADTDDEQWLAWSAAVEAHMLTMAGAGQVQDLNNGTKRTLPKTWDDQMAADTDTEITGVFRGVEHGRVTTVIATFGMGHGAAHPFDGSETLTWLLKDKRALRAEDVFGSVGWEHRVGEMVWADLKSRDKDELVMYDEVKGPDSKPLREVLKDVTNWTLEKDGLHISYPNYTIAPRLYHPDDTVLSWMKLKPLLAKGFVTP